MGRARAMRLQLARPKAQASQRRAAVQPGGSSEEQLAKSMVALPALRLVAPEQQHMASRGTGCVPPAAVQWRHRCLPCCW